MVLVLLAALVNLDHKGLQVYQVLQDPQDLWEHQDLMVLKVNQDQ